MFSLVYRQNSDEELLALVDTSQHLLLRLWISPLPNPNPNPNANPNSSNSPEFFYEAKTIKASIVRPLMKQRYLATSASGTEITVYSSAKHDNGAKIDAQFVADSLEAEKRPRFRSPPIDAQQALLFLPFVPLVEASLNSKLVQDIEHITRHELWRASILLNNYQLSLKLDSNALEPFIIPKSEQANKHITIDKNAWENLGLDEKIDQAAQQSQKLNAEAVAHFQATRAGMTVDLDMSGQWQSSKSLIKTLKDTINHLVLINHSGRILIDVPRINAGLKSKVTSHMREYLRQIPGMKLLGFSPGGMLELDQTHRGYPLKTRTNSTKTLRA